MFITQQSQLEQFCDYALKARVLALDTEFMREKTYYPRLCLLQMQADDETAIVDPFKVRDLSVLSEVFESPRVMKVFHAGSQDIEILFRAVGIMPRPVFDTQIAAAVLGHTHQVGYGALVSSVCGVMLKKADSFTDWSRRPLAPSQLDYAAGDVLYLPEIYRKLSGQLKKLGRLHWLDEDFAALADEKNYLVDPAERWRRLKRVNQLNRRQLSAAREVTKWRELKARAVDIPRRWVLSDEQIVEASRREARSVDQLFLVRGLREKLSLADAREVVDAIVCGLDAPQSQWPRPDGPSKNEANVDVEADVMMAIARLRARQNDIALQTLTGHGDLVALARGYKKDNPLLKGWRRKIVGEELEAFLAGGIELRMEEGNLKVTKVGDSE